MNATSAPSSSYSTLPPSGKERTPDNLQKTNQITTTLKGRVFKTQEIPTSLESNAEISRIMQTWENIALTKENETTSPLEKRSFLDSNFITHLITEDLKTDSTERRVFTCSHENEMRSIALVKECRNRILYLNFLATHPHNIRSPITPEAMQTPYAGTAVMHHLFKTCVEEGRCGIVLNPLNQSKKFYEKFNFKPIIKKSEKEVWGISSKTIKEVLEKKPPTALSPIDPRPIKRKRSS